MSESNRVYENFEDALFRLFMDRVAVVEGERLLRENEDLKSDPNAAVPEEIQKRCLQSVRKGIARRDRKAAGYSVRKLLRFFPLVAIIALLMGLVAYAAFPTFRASVLNLLLTENDRYTTWEYQESDAVQPVGNGLSFEVELPNEYYLVTSEKGESSEFAFYQSRLDESAALEIDLRFGNQLSLKTDNENYSYYEETTIHGNSAVIIEKDDSTALIMSDTSFPYYVIISSNALDRDSLYNIAESMIITR